MITKTRQRAEPTSNVDGAVMIPAFAARSLAGFREWYASDSFPEDGCICYLAGELYVDMGHEPISSHVALKTALTEVLNALAVGTDLGQFFGDGGRVVNERAKISAEPDGCYVSFAAVTDGRVKLRPSNDGEDVTEFVGPVDMVLEVVSPSSVHKDKTLLPELYHRAGVAEYWLMTLASQRSPSPFWRTRRNSRRPRKRTAGTPPRSSIVSSG